MPSRAVDLQTIKEWRELGFYYEVNETDRHWTLTGDRKGLLSFADKLRDYANDPKNEALSEHSHFGPYFYLKIITGDSASISSDGWTGTLSDFLHLADTIEAYLSSAVQRSFVIGKEFAPDSIWVIRFNVETEDFDPSSLDFAIQHRS